MSEKVSGHSFVYFGLVLCNLKGRREHFRVDHSPELLCRTLDTERGKGRKLFCCGRMLEKILVSYRNTISIHGL